MAEGPRPVSSLARGSRAAVAADDVLRVLGFLGERGVVEEFALALGVDARDALAALQGGECRLGARAVVLADRRVLRVELGLVRLGLVGLRLLGGLLLLVQRRGRGVARGGAGRR